jgi:hypothetical protein
MNQPETLDRAIDHLRQAIHRRTRWGVARANLGKALELAHRGEEAYEQLQTALRCEDDFDRAFCHERIGAYQARHGWFRNALGSIRAALHEDGGARRATYVEGIAWIEQQLRAAGIDPAETGQAWARACELEIPAGFLAKDEFGRPLPDDVIEVERLVRAERWADAVAQLDKLRAESYSKLFDAAGYAEAGAGRARRAGHPAEALAMMRLVVEAYRYYASGASSGGEGMARMADVRRVEQKLATFDADLDLILDALREGEVFESSSSGGKYRTTAAYRDGTFCVARFEEGIVDTYRYDDAQMRAFIARDHDDPAWLRILVARRGR